MPIVEAESLNVVVAGEDTLTVVLTDDSEVEFQLENGKEAPEELKEKGMEVIRYGG